MQRDNRERAERAVFSDSEFFRAGSEKFSFPEFEPLDRLDILTVCSLLPGLHSERWRLVSDLSKVV